ncbi:uncharacterized protein LOC141658926 isoform X2 [Silene latifolia]|uniref:uncharacterized protein LOC141658926 isoform X2 n=1 Tax=Silene latifolia TaxID=37657 RepID=UPI003D778576
MPGVPPDGVKIFKRGQAHTVTFTGKAPILWSDWSVVHVGDDKDCCHNKFVQYLNDHDATVPGFEGFKDMALHPTGCSCCQDNLKNDESDAYLELRKMSSAHINPYLLDGKEGLVETMLVVDTNGERMYTRIDMPGLGTKNNNTRVEHGGASLFFGGEGSQEHPFDEGGRTYAAGLTFHCTCCKMVDVKHIMKDGVLRVLFRRQTARGSSEMDCRIAFLGKS